ncbi:hypothetical protein DFH28DRAFT_884570 [Melampsora americana]|nr:hypothetical protein DFH28DRAFT_884570 [Melampsora americana]
MKSNHQNDQLQMNAAQSATRKLKEFEESLHNSREQLVTLLSPTETAPEGLTQQYFADQWSRQKAAQSELFANGRAQSLQALVARLIDLEEKIQDAQTRRPRNRTEAEVTELATLPASIVAMEEAIEAVVQDLGSDMFRDLPDSQDPEARLLIKVRVAKERLYEARVGIIELQKAWDKPGHGESFNICFILLPHIIAHTS